MKRLAICIAVAALALSSALPSAYQPWIDPDWFWHVRVGQTLLEGGRVVAPDEISYASVGGAYRRHSWAADEAMARLDARWGLLGYRVGRALLRIALISLVAAACVRAGRSAPFSLACAALLVPLSRVACEVRPAAMAYVALAVISLLVVIPRAPPSLLACAATALLTAGLANVHPLAVVVLAWVGALWTGAALEARLLRDPAKRALAAARGPRLLLLGGGCFLALAVDPRPFGAVEAIWTLRGDPLAAGRWLSEMLPPQMVGGLGWLGIAIGVAAVAALARSRRATAGEWLLLLGNLFLALDLARNLALLEVVALPLLARHGRALARPLLARGRLLLRRRRLRPLASPAGALALSLALLLALALPPLERARREPLPEGRTESYEWSFNPGLAAEWLLAHLPPSSEPRRVLVSYTWGGFLAYRLGPAYKVSQYGQSQLFPAEMWDDLLNHRPDAVKERLLYRDPEAALITRGDSLANHILREAGWREVYRDNLAVVLFPP